MTTEVTQVDYTVVLDEASQVVEIRYQGLQVALLQALTLRVDTVEDSLDTALTGATGSIGALAVNLAALTATVSALDAEVDGDRANRIAADAATNATVAGLSAPLVAADAAEVINRIAGDAAEAAARNVAISAATGPIISAHDALALTVAGHTGDISAIAASQVSVVATVSTLNSNFTALDASFDALAADFVVTDAAVAAEVVARGISEAAISDSIIAKCWKDPVRAATTAAGTLASSFANGSVIDGVTLATGNRILIKDQAAGAENGIYTVNASGAPTRATDANASAKILGMTTLVMEGTVNGDKIFFCSTNASITLGTTALVFAQISGGAAGGLVFLATQTASSSAQLDFTGFISATYDEYVIELVNVKPDTNNVELWMRCSTDGGATYDNSSIYDNASSYFYTGGVGVGASAGDNASSFRLFDTVGSGTGFGCVGSYRFFDPAGAEYKSLSGLGQFQPHATITGKLIGLTLGSSYKNTTAVNAIRFLFSTGNIASGKIRIYGIAKA